MKQPYNVTREFTIEKGCPWYEAQQKFGPPNLNLCEKSSCTYINEPANTWSNLALILAAALLIKKISDKTIRFFSVCVFASGFMSFIYHATNNLLTQYLDFIAMFLVGSFFLAFHSLRVFGKNPRNFHMLFGILFSLQTASLILVHAFDFPIQYTVLLGSVPTILFDLIAGYKEKRLKDYNFFAVALVATFMAQVFAIIDAQRIYCNPENLFFHGHVMWHLLVAVGMFFHGLHMNKMLKSK